MFNQARTDELVPQPLLDLLTLLPESSYDQFIQHLPENTRTELAYAPISMSAESLQAIANAVWATLENDLN